MEITVSGLREITDMSIQELHKSNKIIENINSQMLKAANQGKYFIVIDVSEDKSDYIVDYYKRKNFVVDYFHYYRNIFMKTFIRVKISWRYL